MCNLIRNAEFADNNLSDWNKTGTPSHVANDGNSQLGCVLLNAPGESIRQTILLGKALPYALSVAHKGAAASFTLRLVNQANAVVLEQLVETAASWGVWETAVSLPAGQYTLRLSYTAGTAVLLDDASLAHIPATRQALALQAHRDLSDLATEFRLTCSANGSQTEGDYTQAVNTALREVNAINHRQNLPDVRCLEPADVDTAVERIIFHMLPILHSKASLKPTSVTTGPVTDRFSLLSALEKRMGILPGMGSMAQKSVVQTRLLRPDR